MIVRNAYSPRALLHVERGPGEGAILPLSPDVRIAAPEHGSASAEVSDQPRDNIAKRARILVETEFGGRAALFEFISFHKQAR
jgi:hypothetical protein